MLPRRPPQEGRAAAAADVMFDLFPKVYTERERGSNPHFLVLKKVLAKEKLASHFAIFHKRWSVHKGHGILKNKQKQHLENQKCWLWCAFTIRYSYK